MSTLSLTDRSYVYSTRLLQLSGRLWFLVAALGQWFFAVYVILFYGGTGLAGEPERWNEVLSHGYRPGEPALNLALVAHLAVAALILLAGPLQFLAPLRQRFPQVHRWIGRGYLTIAVLASLSGLYLTWAGGVGGGFAGLYGITGNAIAVLLCTAPTLGYALRRNFARHERWAFRLFLVVSGVWFFRILLMLWLLVFGRPVGFDPETFQGPFLTFLNFAHYLLPLAIYELYLRAKRSTSTARYAMAAGVLVCALLTATGVFAATMGMWLPRI